MLSTTYYLQCAECHEGLILPEHAHLGATWRCRSRVTCHVYSDDYHSVDCRFCNAPHAVEMITTIINTAEAKLQEISTSPSVKLYENFIRKNLSTLHLKHYLNLFGD